MALTFSTERVLPTTGVPAVGFGNPGDFAIDVTNGVAYGPKDPTTGWPGGVVFKGSNGVDGKTVRSGAGVPGAGLGVDGDFYIDTTAKAIYGPKTSGAWGSSTSLIGPAMTVQEEGSALTQRGTINFIGAAVTAADDAANGRTNVTITSGGSALTVQDEGSALTQQSTINFIGAGVTAVNDGANSRTNVTIPGGGGGSGGPQGLFRSQRYYYPTVVGPNPSTGQPVNGRLYLVPFFVAVTTTFDRYSMEVTAGGTAGDVWRPLIYADSSGYPGAILLDAPTINMNQSAGAYEATISQSLTAGLWWIGGVEQGGATTGFTSRSMGAQQSTPPIGDPGGANVNAQVCYMITAINGTGAPGSASAPPTTFPALVSSTTSYPVFKLRTA